MESALLQAKRSTCFRLNVGAVIVEPIAKTIIATGYNGPPADEPHCEGGMCAGHNGCQRAVHAEVNALNKIREGVRMPRSLDIYTTHSPCPACMQDIHEGGDIGRVFFQTEYRIADHLLRYIPHLAIYKVTPAGYITLFGSNTLVDSETLYG